MIGGIYQNDHSASSTAPNKTVTVYPDGATVSYDHAAHALAITLPGGGTADIAIPDLIAVTYRTADVTASDSATVYAKRVTRDAPDIIASGNLQAQKTLTRMQGMVGSASRRGRA